MKARKRRSEQRLSDQPFDKADLRVWQHPTVASVIEALEVFSLDPGDGKLAASLILTFDQLTRCLKRDVSDFPKRRFEAFQSLCESVFDWLKSQIDSQAYPPEPARATNQVEKALTCALTLYCAQILQCKLSQQTREKAYSYLGYMAQQGWPRDDLLPFVVSQLKKPHELVASANQQLLDRMERWRSQQDVRGIAFSLIQFKRQLGEIEQDALVSTMKVALASTCVETSAKAWGLLALSGVSGTTHTDLKSLAESLLDDLAQDRLVYNEVTPAIRLINQFPFSTPAEIASRIERLQQKEYAPARLIRGVDEKGILIDLFGPIGDETWSFALDATQVAFTAYALIATGHYEIVGFPIHYRTLLEDTIERQIALQTEKATTIPTKYVKLYNLCAILVFLEIGASIGASVAVISGGTWQNGLLIGVATTSIISIVNLFKQQFVIIGMWDWIKKQIETITGVLGKS